MKTFSKSSRTAILAGTLLAAMAFPSQSDEGMWLYNNPPKEQVRKKYGFEITDAWLDHMMKSSVRFNSGGSGSFVSSDGLVISNHHVGADALQKLGSEKKNYLADGFYARTLSEEVKCVDLELNVLQSIEDVTARVNTAVGSGLSAEEAFRARRKAIAAIEKESLDKTGLRSDVVALYQGGQYHLYRFKRYTDVRLVFAPEQQIAFFGGDPDNFEYPRFDLDICLFRVYEDGKPARVQNFLKWSAKGAADGELTFVSGHPGRTSRLLTMAELEYMRDSQFPYLLGRLKRMEVLLRSWSERSGENARRAREDLFGVQNSRKARDGGHAGLYDPVLMSRKRSVEQAFRARLEGKAEFAEAARAYAEIAEAQKELGKISLRHRLLEVGHAFGGHSFGIARTLLRASVERSKPNGERLTEFSDSAKASLELKLFSDEPLYEDYEILLLSDALTFLSEQLGASDPTVVKILAGKSPRERASELILGTKVRSIEKRKELYNGGSAAVASSSDPMIELARMVDEESRALRKIAETQDERKRQAHGAIARARFALEGTSKYPDATFTLRLAYGAVSGYEEGGKKVPHQTTFAGLYERAASQNFKVPFDLPPRWLERKKKLNPGVPLNFVSTQDIIGGNSGSPVVNRAGEFVGIIFDGNIQSLVLDFEYTDVVARALSVHSSGILEALNKVYDAKPLAQELITGRRGGAR